MIARTRLQAAPLTQTQYRDAPQVQPSPYAGVGRQLKQGLASNLIEQGADKLLTTGAGGAVGAALTPLLGPLGPLAGSLLGGLFNEGGQVPQQGGMDIAQLLNSAPPEVQQLVDAFVSGQISPQQLMEALTQMGVPEEVAMQIIKAVSQQQTAPPQQFNDGGQVDEMVVMEVGPETTAPISKVKKKVMKGHNSEEVEVSFDTKHFSDPSLVPPMSAAAMKAFS